MATNNAVNNLALSSSGIVSYTGGGTFTTLTTGSSGQLLQSNGTSTPGWTTATYPTTVAQGDLLYGSASNVLSTLAKNTTATRYLANTGTSNAPEWDQVALTTGVTGTLPVSNGGTGQSSLTIHTVLVGNGSSAITQIPVGTSGQLFVGSTGADPAFVNPTSTTINFFSTGGSNFSAEVTGGGISWTAVASATQTLTANAGYYTNNGATPVAFTLPTTAAAGSVIRIAGFSSGGWSVAQNASQSIHFGSLATTTGTGGSLASTNQYDAIELLCTVANTTFVVLASIGNITVV